MDSIDGSRSQDLLNETRRRLSAVRTLFWLNRYLATPDGEENKSAWPQELVELATGLDKITSIRSAIRTCIRLGCLEPPPEADVFFPALAGLNEALRELSVVSAGIKTEGEPTVSAPVLDDRLEEAESQLQVLEDCLRDAQAQRNQKVEQKKGQIEELRKKAERMKEETAETVKKLEIQTQEEMEVINAASAVRLSSLTGNLEVLREQLRESVLQHEEQERVLKKEKRGLERKLDELQKDYKNKMYSQETRKQDLMRQLTSTKASWDKVSSRASRLGQQYESILGERRLAAEQEKERLAREKRRAHAATLIQAVWRGHITRQSLKPKTRRKGGQRRGQRKASPDKNDKRKVKTSPEKKNKDVRV